MKSAFVLSLLAAAAFSTAAVAGNIKSDATAAQPQPKTVAVAPQQLTEAQMDQVVAGTFYLYTYGVYLVNDEEMTLVTTLPDAAGNASEAFLHANHGNYAAVISDEPVGP